MACTSQPPTALLLVSYSVVSLTRGH